MFSLSILFNFIKIHSINYLLIEIEFLKYQFQLDHLDYIYLLS